MSYPTWSDLNNPSIVLPPGSGHASQIGPVAVMASCEPDVRLIRSRHAIAKTLPFFSGTLMTHPVSHGSVGIAGPFIGAPCGVMMLESLIARGAEKILVIGWCGSLGDELAIGDVLVPEQAIVDEGTSMHYLKFDTVPPISCSHDRLSAQLSDHLAANGINACRKTLWTTDAIYRETARKVAFFYQSGARAVEMECSALFSVAQFHGVQIAAALIVSDMVLAAGWTPGFGQKQFKQARKAVCSAVMAFAGKL